MKRYRHGSTCDGEYRCEPKADAEGEFVFYDDIAIDLELAKDLREYVTKHNQLRDCGGSCGCHLCDAIRLVEKWREKLCPPTTKSAS